MFFDFTRIDSAGISVDAYTYGGDVVSLSCLSTESRIERVCICT